MHGGVTGKASDRIAMSIPWPTFIGRTSNIEVAEYFGLRDIKPSQALQSYETLTFPQGDVAVLII
jgi:hypothetical protein